MQDTVDPAAAPPRTLAQIIEDAARCAATAWLTARRGRSAVPARTVGTRQGSPERRGLISEAGMASCCGRPGTCSPSPARRSSPGEVSGPYASERQAATRPGTSLAAAPEHGRTNPHRLMEDACTAASQEPAIGEVLALLIGNRARQQLSEGRPA
jgi:transposase InsO family protein